MDLQSLYAELQKGAPSGAKALLGWKLVHELPEGRISGYIVEVEAYTQDDPASHTFKGLTKRNAAMFEGVGTIYVYFTYGMHYCINIVCGVRGYGEGVLIRALEPVEGIELMIQRRGMQKISQLTNGPGKLTKALGIIGEQTGSLLGDKIHLEAGFNPDGITQTSRVGISKAKDQPWRYYVTNNPYVSKR